MSGNTVLSLFALVFACFTLAVQWRWFIRDNPPLCRKLIADTDPCDCPDEAVHAKRVELIARGIIKAQRRFWR